MKQVTSMSRLANQLEKMFRLLNADFFNSELDMPIIHHGVLGNVEIAASEKLTYLRLRWIDRLKKLPHHSSMK